MVQAINKDNFSGRQMVTCFTCHRNRDRPLTTPTMEMLYGMPPLEPDDYLPQAQGVPPVDQIFAKYITAIGGQQKVHLENIQYRSRSGWLPYAEVMVGTFFLAMVLFAIESFERDAAVRIEAHELAQHPHVRAAWFLRAAPGDVLAARRYADELLRYERAEGYARTVGRFRPHKTRYRSCSIAQ